MPTDYSLAWLLAPVSPAAFLTTHWEKSPLLVARDRADYYGELLTPADLDRVVTEYGLSHPDINIANAARDVPRNEYAYPDGLIDAARLYQQFADGGTIIFQQLNHHHGHLAALCRALEAEVNSRFQTNVYYTPRNAQGFKAHYDSHDVFVLQLQGTKRWTLYDTPVELPYRGQRFQARTTPRGAVTQQFELQPGDAVYIPRGVMHDAATGESDSLHVTLGVLATSWTDLLLEAVALAGLRDPAFRRALPVGFARPDFDRESARQAFVELLGRLGGSAEFDAALDHFVDDLVSTRHPLVPGQRAQLDRLATLDADARLRPRPGLLFTLRERDEAVVVACYGGEFRFPRHVAPALRFALGAAEFTPRELPGGLDEPGRLVLVRRLVREGLLMFV